MDFVCDLIYNHLLDAHKIYKAICERYDFSPDFHLSSLKNPRQKSEFRVGNIFFNFQIEWNEWKCLSNYSP